MIVQDTFLKPAIKHAQYYFSTCNPIIKLESSTLHIIDENYIYTNENWKVRYIRLGILNDELGKEFMKQITEIEHFLSIAYKTLWPSWMNGIYFNNIFKSILKETKDPIYIYEIHLNFPYVNEEPKDCMLYNINNKKDTSIINKKEWIKLYVNICGIWSNDKTYGIKYDLTSIRQVHCPNTFNEIKNKITDSLFTLE